MAIALVDIRIYTMADILESIEKSEDDISVKLKIIDLKKDHLENYQKAYYEEQIPDLTALERAELTKLKGDNIVQVIQKRLADFINFISLSPLIQADFIHIQALHHRPRRSPCGNRNSYKYF